MKTAKAQALFAAFLRDFHGLQRPARRRDQGWSGDVMQSTDVRSGALFAWSVPPATTWGCWVIGGRAAGILVAGLQEARQANTDARCPILRRRVLFRWANSHAGLPGDPRGFHDGAPFMRSEVDHEHGAGTYSRFVAGLKVKRVPQRSAKRTDVRSSTLRPGARRGTSHRMGPRRRDAIKRLTEGSPGPHTSPVFNANACRRHPGPGVAVKRLLSEMTLFPWISFRG
jgi:hypothetical protein